jgi:HD-GYP domain-containing protein (c-di-GMP phosphodiesterase class II)
VPGLEVVATIVRYHHERWDGSGYPDGLSGARIPLASRIIAVCDSFNAMTSDRPYRRAMSHEDALAEMQVHAGWQFDPDLALRVEQVFERKVAA